MFEDDGVGFVKVFRDFNDDGLFFELPEGVEDPIRNNHDIRFVLVRFSLHLLVARLMHVPEHLESRRASRYL